MPGDNYQSDYILESIVIESDRLNKTVEITNPTTDLEIFEHLDKPYLTADLVFMDTSNAYTQMDLLGAETVTIKLKSTREGSKTIEKRFVISKIMATQKANENSDMLVLHLIEDVAYYASLYNVNRVYSGNALQILEKITKNYFDGKEVLTGNRKPKQFMKAIVPNLNPLETMIWIKNRAKTVDGLPFYLFSSLTSEYFWFVDLGTLLEEPVINKIPYKYSSSASKSTDPDQKRRVIYNYSQKKVEDLYSLLGQGFVGSNYEYIDTLTNRRKSFHFDLTQDALQPVINKGIVQANQPNVLYSSDYKWLEKSFNEYNSKTITRIGGINSYKETDNEPFVLAFGESETLADYKLNVISDALDKLMKKSPLTVDIPGIDFIDGDKNSTVGCMIRLQFPISLPNKAPDVPAIDTKKSGDYLIFAARHKFKSERYDLSLSCLKLANYRSQS